MKTLLQQLLPDYGRPRRRRTNRARHSSEILESRRVLSAVSGHITTTLTQPIAEHNTPDADSQGSAEQPGLESDSSDLGSESVATVPLEQHAVHPEVRDALMTAITYVNDPSTINDAVPTRAWIPHRFAHADTFQDSVENRAGHQSFKDTLIEQRDDMTVREWIILINKGVMSGNPG